MSNEVGEALDIPVSEHIFWTDSMNVQYLFRSDSKRIKVDIGNRISSNQEVTSASQCRHVPGK